MARFTMSFGARGQGRGNSSRGRGNGGGGCALFSVDDEPVRPLQLLGDPVAGETRSANESSTGNNIEVDPLDAFMESLSSDTSKKQAKSGNFEVKPAWEEFELEDAVVSYLDAYEQGKGPENSDSDASDADPEGPPDDEGNEQKRKAVAPLPRVNHSEIAYADVQMNFYKLHPDISKLTAEQVGGLRSDLGISATGPECPSPAVSFGHLGLPSSLMDGIRAHGYSKPTPIQSQALPAGLSGRDVIGVAETGSGKTVAYLLPMLVHCAAQPELKKDEGPIGVVLCPTRELAIQVEKEAYKFNKLLGLRSTTLAGGLSKKEQFKDIKSGSEIIIANPGRMIDIIKMKGFTLRRCTMIVLDEADRMLDMGFLGDVNSISQCVRPDRQVLFFSATWNDDVQALARTLCDPHGQGPVRIASGQNRKMENGVAAKHQAREGIEQRVVVVDDSSGDWKQQVAQKRSFMERYIKSVLESSEDNKILVFVSQKQVADDLSNTLYEDGFAANSMHGGKAQENRLWVLDQFRQGKLRLLVCTDVIGRGIDLPNVSHVVIYEMGSIDDYIHRIGRTGRGPHGKGQALVLFEYWDKEPEIASELIEVLNASQQPVPEELRRVAAEVASGKRGNWQNTQSKWNQWDIRGSSNGWNGSTGGYSGKKASDKKIEGGIAGNEKVANQKTEEAMAKMKKVEPPEEVPDAWDD